MSIEPSTLAVILATTLAQLALVAVIGSFLMRRKPPILSGAPTPDDVLAEIQQLAQLHSKELDVSAPVFDEINKALSQSNVAHDSMLATIAQAIEISQLKGKIAHAQEQIEEQARRIDFHVAESRVDPLTNLANRRALDEELTRRFSETKRTGHRFCLMLVDIDHFKRLNDTFGHTAGDQALRQVATVLRATMREMDLIARYGGEEFAIVLPATDLTQGQCAAERTRLSFERATFEIEGRPQKITISVGIAEAVRDETINLLIRRTDAALYAAKAHGRDTTFCHDSGQLKRVSPVPSEQEVRRASETLLPSLPEVELDPQLALVAN